MFATAHYDADDIVHLMRNVDHMTLMRASSGLRLLRAQAHAVEAWRDFIPLYRSVRCQPLDFFYAYLQCLGAFDEPLLEDLLTACTWRGVIWGSWLVALAPQPHFRDRLIEARPNAPRNQWIVDLGLAVLDREQPQELAEHLALLAQIRDALAPLPKPIIKLRRNPDPLQRRDFEKERSILRDIYRNEGLEAARAYMDASPWRALASAYQIWNWCQCVIDNGDGDGSGPNRNVWFWSFTV
jgi:hypothetical protein